MRILTWNILVDRGEDSLHVWRERKHKIAALVRRHEPDVFCAQEALEDQKCDLAALLPEYACFGAGRDDGAIRGEQVPIFHRESMFALLEERAFWLSDTPDAAGSIGWDAKRPRTAVLKILRSRTDGREVTLVNTHYDHVGKEAKIQSAQVIAGRLPGGNCPVVLCGDFNAPTGSEPYCAVLAQGFSDASAAEGIVPCGPEFTYHRFWMHRYVRERAALMKEHDRVFRTIDHIFLRGACKVLRYEILSDNDAGDDPSDHFAVLCDVDFGFPAIGYGR